MRRTTSIISSLTITLLAMHMSFATLPVACAVDVPPESIRNAIERSLPYIHAEGVAWIEEKDCLSCHRVSNMIWSLESARLAGFETDESVDDWKQWAIESSQALDDSGSMAAAKNKEGTAQFLLADAQRTLISEKDRSEFLKILIDGQDADGTWAPDGQLPSQKRPKLETRATSTAWIALALGQAEDRERTSAPLRKAIWALNKTFADENSGEYVRPVSTEWFAVRLLLANQQGESVLANELRETLMQSQHADGGWGWITEDPSDALGTGLALYALESSGVITQEIRNRAVGFLVRSQLEDGSWPVHGTKANKKNKVQETATYWGTTWAALALLESLANTEATASPPTPYGTP